MNKQNNRKGRLVIGPARNESNQAQQTLLQTLLHKVVTREDQHKNVDLLSVMCIHSTLSSDED